MDAVDQSDAVGKLLGQVATVLTNSHNATANAHGHASAVAQHLATIAGYGHTAAWALLPLCLAVLALHEHYRSIAEDAPFRVTHVLAKTGAVIACLVAFPLICRLITHVAGGGGGWMSSSQYETISDWDQSTQALGDAWKQMGSMGDIPKFVAIILIWVLVMVAALFAYVAGVLLSVLQSVYLAVLLGLGKICIVVTLLPNVKLGWSWAKSLAQVAAWSTVVAVINGLLGVQTIAVHDLIVSGQLLPLLQASAHFIVLALLTLAVPMVTAKAWSGAAPGLGEAGLGLMAAVGMGRKAMGAGKTAGKAGKETAKAVRDAGKVARNATGGRMVSDFLKAAYPKAERQRLAELDAAKGLEGPTSAYARPAASGGGGAGGLDSPTPVASKREQLLLQQEMLREDLPGDAAAPARAPDGIGDGPTLPNHKRGVGS